MTSKDVWMAQVASQGSSSARTMTQTAMIAFLVSELMFGPIDAPTSMVLRTDAAQPSTNRGSVSVLQEVDVALVFELQRVRNVLAANQAELDADAKRVLYSRLRDLYRR